MAREAGIYAEFTTLVASLFQRAEGARYAHEEAATLIEVLREPAPSQPGEGDMRARAAGVAEPQSEQSDFNVRLSGKPLRVSVRGD